MSVVAVIPARFASTRLPGKPLLDRTGRAMIVHVVEQAARANCIDDVIVATDDARIQNVVAAAGFKAVMTRADHPNGTSRIAEVAAGLPANVDVVVNVQGDEPQIDPEHIDAAVERLCAGEEPMATIASPFQPGEDTGNPNIVKVVLDQRGRAMYFSRSLIPYPRTGSPTVLKHIGLYVYRRDFLPTYISLPATPCEQAEALEQLRALEHGHPIAAVIRTVRHTGIDTPEQYEAFVRHMTGR
ncbi:MAG: 3-deoxy-manno-octulosonate cytidylyltransferase [Planctomycetes bacterium]|nr:3-deoxy-manno-octulosonate cytidylyltransferase [Planctomycetota bacterium]